MASDGASEDDDSSGPGTPPSLTTDDLEQIQDPAVRTKVEHMVEQRFEMIRSPLIPPEILARYGNVVPGLPEKIVQWTEDESQHRRILEKAAFEEARTLRSRAQLSGVGVAALGIVVAGLTAVFGDSAGSNFVAAVIAIVSVGGPFAARVLAGRMGGSNDSAD